MGSGERDGKRESFNGAAEGNGGSIDANFTNSHELIQRVKSRVRDSCQIGEIRVSNLIRRLPRLVQRGGFRAAPVRDVGSG
jgi:hypothetical protein